MNCSCIFKKVLRAPFYPSGEGVIEELSASLLSVAVSFSIAQFTHTHTHTFPGNSLSQLIQICSRCDRQSLGYADGRTG